MGSIHEPRSETPYHGATPDMTPDNKDRDIEASRKFDDATTEPVPVGVARIEAFYKVYSNVWLVRSFWACFVLWAFASALSSDTTWYYLAFATSYFERNPVLATISLLTGIMAGVIPPFWAKLADFTVRSWCLLIGVTLYTLGYAISAGANSVTTLSAGQIIYTIGNSGMGFMQSLIIADLTSLQWRGLVNGLVSLTYIPFAFVAPNITSGIGSAHWRWGYGMFCVLMPVCLAPIIASLFWADSKAKKRNIVSATQASIRIELVGKEDASIFAKALHILRTIDAFGLLLLGFSFALLLSPPTLVSQATGGWKNPSMIAMMTVGGSLFIAFCIWEWKFASHPVMAKRIMNRTFVMCLIIDFMYYLVGYLTDVYWASWVWVVQNYSEKNYTYMGEIETVTLCAFGVLAGAILRYTHRYKYLQIFGLALRCLGSGINYWSSTGHTNTATLFFAKFILCLGGAFEVVASQVASQGSVPHQDLGMAIAILSLFTRIGGAIGSAISGAIWSHVLPKRLAYHVPTLNVTEIALYSTDITSARLAEPREGITAAYNDAYKALSGPALGLIFIPLIAALFTKNFYLDDSQNAVERVVMEPQGEDDDETPSPPTRERR